MLTIQRNTRVNTRHPRAPKRSSDFELMLAWSTGKNRVRRTTTRPVCHSLSHRDYPSRNCPIETRHALRIYNLAQELLQHRIIGGRV